MKKSSKILLSLPLIISLISACSVKLGTNAIIATPTPASSVPNPVVSKSPDLIIDSIGQVDFKKILSGERSDLRNYDAKVIDNESDFQQLWENHTGSKTNPLFLPKIDFDFKNVVAIFLGDRPTTGFSIDIDRIDESKDTMSIYLKENKPAEGTEVKAELTQPFLMIELKKTKKKIIFENSSLSKPQIIPINFNSLETGYDSGIKDFSKRLAKNQKEFSTLYKEHISSQKTVNAIVFPTIDFDSNMVAAIFLGERPSTGYSVNVKSIVKTDSQIIISATEKPPDSGSTVSTIVTEPYQFITLPKSDLPVNFDISLIVPKISNNADNTTNIVPNKEIATNQLISGDKSSIDTSQYQVIRNKSDFKDLWTQHTNSKDSIPPLVDFLSDDVIAVFIGKKPTTGYSVKISNIFEYNNEIRVFVDLSLDKTVPQNVSTSPFSMVTIPKSNKQVTFIINNMVSK
ncbi:MAG: protease complex subunit PrcB family protein [Candidatus Sericytochromatia bacterium]|nr:protease complex subunit PrcB family protein [Candidatus Sericytochromatia bacterium]